MIWLWIYLGQAVIVTIIATRLAFRMQDGTIYGPGDAATMGVGIGLFWPAALVVMLLLFSVHALFEGLGKVLTLGAKR